MLHCGGLLVLVMPVDCKAPGLPQCLEMPPDLSERGHYEGKMKLPKCQNSNK
jgi:hypothetical protein